MTRTAAMLLTLFRRRTTIFPGACGETLNVAGGPDSSSASMAQMEAIQFNSGLPDNQITMHIPAKNLSHLGTRDGKFSRPTLFEAGGTDFPRPTFLEHGGTDFPAFMTVFYEF